MLHLCLRKFLLALYHPTTLFHCLIFTCICVMPVTVNDTQYCRRWSMHCLLILLVWMIRRRWLSLYLQWCSGLVDRLLYTLCKDQMETTRHLYLHTSVLSCQKCKNTSLYDYMMCKCLWCADYRYYPRIWILVKCIQEFCIEPFIGQTEKQVLGPLDWFDFNCPPKCMAFTNSFIASPK